MCPNDLSDGAFVLKYWGSRDRKHVEQLKLISVERPAAVVAVKNCINSDC